MKMAEKSVMLTFQNNCEAINSNCVEVRDEISDGKTSVADNNDIIANGGDDDDGEDDDGPSAGDKCDDKPEDEPSKGEEIDEVVVVAGNGDAVDEFLAGDHKNDDDFADELLLANIEAENDGIDFKTDNVIVDCADLEKNDFSDAPEDEEEKIAECGNPPESPAGSADEGLDIEMPSTENNDDDLSKMQIMEAVREAGGVQPNSPGHAEEPHEDPIQKEENGFDIDAAEQEDENNAVVINGSPVDDHKEDDSNEDVIAQKDQSEPDQDNSNAKEDEIPDNNNHNNEESSNSSEETSSTSNKRKAESPETSTKRLRLDIQENFFSRDKILSEFIEMADCGNVEQLQNQTEQILAEIRTLNELAKEKEREWNNIIHLKKMKEELLLRMQRRKQVILLTGGDKNDNGDVGLSESQDCRNNQSILKSNHNKSLKTSKQRSILPKNNQLQQQQFEINGDFGKQQNKQRPILDVQSIIADYRQRHPEAVPRRGRRIRALGSGAQVHQNQNYDVNSELGLILNALESSRGDASRPSSAESSAQGGSEPCFKDMLVQFAKLSQTERNELIQNAIKPPPPYPEVTVHPVPTTTAPAPTNSLLHGILTKSPSKSSANKTSFSPTLARLLTAPERGNGQAVSTSAVSNNIGQAANMSISEILSTSKARNEITITPVGGQYDGPIKNKNLAHVAEEDEAEDSADRLVIDESTEIIDGKARGGDNSSDAGDEVPQCQGCNQKSALFVCAGCGNQWYCSRECQVSAWDEHSEVCSG